MKRNADLALTIPASLLHKFPGVPMTIAASPWIWGGGGGGGGGLWQTSPLWPHVSECTYNDTHTSFCTSEWQYLHSFVHKSWQYQHQFSVVSMINTDTYLNTSFWMRWDQFQLSRVHWCKADVRTTGYVHPNMETEENDSHVYIL
jgi:hypothetical protein